MVTSFFLANHLFHLPIVFRMFWKYFCINTYFFKKEKEDAFHLQQLLFCNQFYPGQFFNLDSSVCNRCWSQSFQVLKEVSNLYIFCLYFIFCCFILFHYFQKYFVLFFLQKLWCARLYMMCVNHIYLKKILRKLAVNFCLKLCLIYFDFQKFSSLFIVMLQFCTAIFLKELLEFLKYFCYESHSNFSKSSGFARQAWAAWKT